MGLQLHRASRSFKDAGASRNHLCWGVGLALIRVVAHRFGPVGGDARGRAARSLVVADYYLVRHGVMGRVGRFPALEGCPRLERGGLVVLETSRGRELGEVLVALESRWDGMPAADSSESIGVVRPADRDDERRGRLDRQTRASLLELFQRVLAGEDWPAEIVDVDVLLDEHTTVLHYLGPRPPDGARLRARFRMEYDLEVHLESIGEDEPEQESEGGSCGTGCGSRGGCGGDEHDGQSQSAGCGSCASGSCALGALAEKRRARTEAPLASGR